MFATGLQLGAQHHIDYLVLPVVARAASTGIDVCLHVSVRNRQTLRGACLGPSARVIDG
jgi:hypothetical protein